MGIKISELESTTTANANDVFIINQNGATKKITKENLENEIINPELEERVDDLEEEVESLQTKVTDLEETVNSELEDGVAEGTEITVNDSAVADASLDIAGNTEQTQYEGYSLYGGFEVESSFYGMNYKYYLDGSIQINGTSTANTNSMNSAQAVSGGYTKHLQAGTYILSGGSSDVTISLVTNVTGSWTVQGTTSSTTVVLNSECDYFIRAEIQSGKTVNKIVYPMLILGSTAKPYEPFVGGQASPSPEYPQKIEVVKADGVQLFDEDLITSTTGTIKYLPINVKQNTDYTLSTDSGSSTSANVFLSTSNSGVTTANNGAMINSPRTINSGSNDIMYVGYRNDLSTNWIKLEEGSLATPWTPYGYGLLDIKVSNKNWLKVKNEEKEIISNGITAKMNKNGKITLNGTSTGGVYIEFVYDFKSGTTVQSNKVIQYNRDKNYIFSVKAINDDGIANNKVVGHIQIDSSENINCNKNSITSFSNSDGLYRGWISMSSGTTCNNLVIEMMVLEGNYTYNTLPEYLGHKEQTLPLTLPSGLEMCKAGDYKDEFVKDLSTGKWYKDEKINSREITQIISKSGSTRNNQFYTQNFDEVLAPSDNSKLIKVYSNYFISKTANDIYLSNIQGISVNSNKSFSIGFGLESEINTIELANSWLSNNSLKVYYPLATPQLIEITDETLIAELDDLLKLRTYYEQTNITVEAEDAKPFMTLNYKKSNRILRSEIDTIKARLDLLEN